MDVSDLITVFVIHKSLPNPKYANLTLFANKTQDETEILLINKNDENDTELAESYVEEYEELELTDLQKKIIELIKLLPLEIRDGFRRRL